MAIITSGQTAFFKFEIENGDARRKKAALQGIARRYRQGDRLNAEGRNSFEKIINGIVLSERDLKVVRWCLNALARLGTREGCSKYVCVAIKQFEQHPEIVAAGVAAIAHLYNGSLDAAPDLGSIDPAILTLAAMQTADARKLDLSNLKIDIDTSDDEVLKLALLLVGLNRDIQNLFHPRHTNGEIVRQLCQHDNVIVRQYGVWSVLENRRLTLDDLGIPFDSMDNQPVNPRVIAKRMEHNLIRARSVYRELIAGGNVADVKEIAKHRSLRVNIRMTTLTHTDLEELAAILEQSGDYKVLRRFQPRIAPINAPAPTERLGIFLDLETTGLDPAKDEIIEIAMVPFLYTVRAVTDCQAAIEILGRPLPQSGRTALSALLHEARQRTCRVWAEGASFDLKDILKARRYRWSSGEDGGRKCWYIDVPEGSLEVEVAFLYNEIYQRELDIPITYIDAYARFSTRL